jgi:hypothetical protein
MARLNILKLRAVAPPAPLPEPEPVAVPATLCRCCAVAHIVNGDGAGEVMILCGLNGWLRELPFPVSTCTDYRVRGERVAGLVGFGASL